ncbi:MAG: EthD family reductase [Steroidobacteraceae bacterium]
MARMVVIYRTPKNVEAFDRHYFETHIPLAKKIPGLRKYEVSRGPVTVLAGSPDVYLVGTVYFDDLEAMKKAFASAEGQAAAADRQIYAPDDTGVQMFLFDDTEV